MIECLISQDANLNDSNVTGRHALEQAIKYKNNDRSKVLKASMDLIYLSHYVSVAQKNAGLVILRPLASAINAITNK